VLNSEHTHAQNHVRGPTQGLLDLDVVAPDTTQEFSDRAVLPASRSREPCRALSRAEILVLTRSELGDAARLENTVHRIYPSAEVFRSRLRRSSLSRITSGERTTVEALQHERIFAFCAIANPSTFFMNVGRWGFQVVGQRALPDHQVYTQTDRANLIRRALELHAAALITTEKHVMNLPPAGKPALDVYASQIEMEIENSAVFEAAL
jgi:tetraacyldisaccharide 4'-kinase